MSELPVLLRLSYRAYTRYASYATERLVVNRILSPRLYYIWRRR